MHKASLFKLSISTMAVVLLSGLLFGALPPGFPASPQRVKAIASIEFFPNYGIATIDGQVGASEWSNADSAPFITDGNTHIAGTFYVMQSNTDLYIGVTLADDEFTQEDWSGLLGDTIFFDFDDDNSGELYETGENRFINYAYSPWYRDDYFRSDEDGGYSYPDTYLNPQDPPGVNNGYGRAARHDDLNHYEMSFPLCSGDTYDFCLHPGDAVGLRVKYYDIYPVDESTNNVIVGYFPSQNRDELALIHISEFKLVYLPLIRK